MTQEEAIPRTPVRDKDGTWMLVVSADKYTAICRYSDGHGIHEAKKQLSELKEVAE